MFMRLLLTCGIFISMGLLTAAAPLNQTEKTHSGVVVSAGAGKLVLSDSEGNNEIALLVSDKTSVMLDGVPAKLVDLMKGDMVSATVGDDGEVVSIVAKREKKK